MGDNWAVEVLRDWKARGIETNPPSTILSITEVEEKVSFKFSGDFRELYSVVNGFKNHYWLPNMFSIWPLERIVEEFEQRQHKNFVGFADYLINSHAIGFYKDRKGIYKDVDTNLLISETFKNCIELINTDSEKIF
jgi:hypothetical protein